MSLLRACAAQVVVAQEAVESVVARVHHWAGAGRAGGAAVADELEDNIVITVSANGHKYCTVCHFYRRPHLRPESESARAPGAVSRHGRREPLQELRVGSGAHLSVRAAGPMGVGHALLAQVARGGEGGGGVTGAGVSVAGGSVGDDVALLLPLGPAAHDAPAD